MLANPIPPDDSDLPPSLARALVEPAEYALRLRTGEVVHFTHAERHGAFVVLYAPSGPSSPRQPDMLAAFPHGLEARISDIVWVARGPHQGPSPAAADDGPGGVRIPLRIQQGETGGQGGP